MSKILPWNMDRRRFMLGVTGSVLALAGCQTPRETSVQTETTTGGAPASRTDSRANCDETVTRYEIAPDTVHYESFGPFEISANEEEIARVDSLEIELRNRSDSTERTGNKSKFDIERERDDGWRSIFWHGSGPIPSFHDDEVTHAPHTGFTWTVTLTRTGLSHAVTHGTGRRRVCHPLSPGGYRFIYWGISNPDDTEASELGLAVRFTVTDSRDD